MLNLSESQFLHLENGGMWYLTVLFSLQLGQDGPRGGSVLVEASVGLPGVQGAEDETEKTFSLEVTIFLPGPGRGTLAARGLRMSRAVLRKSFPE